MLQQDPDALHLKPWSSGSNRTGCCQLNLTTAPSASKGTFFAD